MKIFCRETKRITFLTLAAVFAVSGCGRILLAPKPQKGLSIKSEGVLCAAPPKRTNRLTKFLFLIDKSGSNGSTDPGNTGRADKIENFYNKSFENPLYRWGYIVFHGDLAYPYITDDGNTPIFTDEETRMRDAISRQRSDGDTGSTPYRAALNNSRNAIRHDLEQTPDEDNVYMVFMMSDGEPTDISSDPELMGIVRELVNLSPDRIFLSTAYYGPPNATAENRLENMAKEGKGKYVNVNNDPDFEFDDLLVGGPTAEPWVVKRMGVYNLNSGFCDDKTVDLDSDGDGLCDKDELKYNAEFKSNPDRLTRMQGKEFDPYNRFSWGPGFSDSFHHKRITLGQALAKCSDNTDEDFDIATKCEEQYLYNATPQGPTTAWTQAMTKNGNPKNPDSDGDGFLDILEFFQFKDRSTPLNYNSLTKLYDRMEGEQIMREHRHPKAPHALPEGMIYDTVFEHLGLQGEDQNCYQVSQENMPLYPTANISVSQAGGNELLAHNAGENVVLVWYVQVHEKDPDGKGILKYSYQRLKYSDAATGQGSGAGLKFDETNFKSYKIPNL